MDDLGVALFLETPYCINHHWDLPFGELSFPGIPRPQFLGSLRRPQKCNERPQKCNFKSCQKGLPNMFSSMHVFFVFFAVFSSIF